MSVKLIPNLTKLVKAYGEKSNISISDEYDPEPDSGLRKRLPGKLERMTCVDRQAILDTAHVRL